MWNFLSNPFGLLDKGPVDNTFEDLHVQANKYLEACYLKPDLNALSNLFTENVTFKKFKTFEDGKSEERDCFEGKKNVVRYFKDQFFSSLKRKITIKKTSPTLVEETKKSFVAHISVSIDSHSVCSSHSVDLTFQKEGEAFKIATICLNKCSIEKNAEDHFVEKFLDICYFRHDATKLSKFFGENVTLRCEITSPEKKDKETVESSKKNFVMAFFEKHVFCSRKDLEVIKQPIELEAKGGGFKAYTSVTLSNEYASSDHIMALIIQREADIYKIENIFLSVKSRQHSA